MLKRSQTKSPKGFGTRSHAVSISPASSADRTLQITVYSNERSFARLRFRFLDRDRRELLNDRGEVEHQPFAQIGLGTVVNCSSRTEMRIRKRLGDTIYSGAWMMAVPDNPLKQSRYCSLLVEAISTDCINPRPSEPMLLERRKCDMALGDTPKSQYGFPMTEDEIAQRLNGVVHCYRSLRKDTEQATDAVVRLWLNLRGGYDSPLLDLDEENKS